MGTRRRSGCPPRIDMSRPLAASGLTERRAAKSNPARPGTSARAAAARAKGRGGRSGRSADTNVPRAGSVAIHPSADSSRYAASAVFRCTPSERASSRLPGRRAPGLSRPRRTSSAMARAMRRNAGSPAEASGRANVLGQEVTALV